MPVQPGVPAAFHAFPADAKRDRSGLARWLVDPRQSADGARGRQPPVAGSVRHRASSGRARSSALRANCPSHPELLDWLATEYVRLDWDTEGDCCKLIVTSAAYRQSSQVDAGAGRARSGQPPARPRPARSRLSAETVRDQALAVERPAEPQDVRPAGASAAADLGLAAAFGGEHRLGDQHGRGPLPPRRCTPLAAQPAVPVDDHVRRPERSVCTRAPRSAPTRRCKRW